MSAEQVIPLSPCLGCRGRGWTFVPSRRHTAALLIEGVIDSATKIDCLDCDGSGLAA